MTFAIQFVIDVLSLGGAYALMALGLVIVFGILRLVNFAYGELIMVAGYTMFLVGGSGLPWLVMAVVAVVMAMLAGIATDYVAFRPVRAKSVTAVLITSFAFSTLLQNAALLFISPRPRAVPLPALFSQTVQIGGVDHAAAQHHHHRRRGGAARALRAPDAPDGARHRHARGGDQLHHGADARRAGQPDHLLGLRHQRASSPASSGCCGSGGSARSFPASGWSRCSSPSSPPSSAACAA